VAEHPEQYTRRLGKGMIALAWVVGLAALTWLFNGWLTDQHNPNRDPQTAVSAAGVVEVVLLRNRQGHYLADGRINGEPVTFLLDTGATTLSIPEAIARRAGLQRGQPQVVQTANGSVTVYATRVERLELGGIVVRDVRANINPHYQGEQILLGMSFLKQVDFMQRGNTLTLWQELR
jgi:aspartyl protease family protein